MSRYQFRAYARRLKMVRTPVIIILFLFSVNQFTIFYLDRSLPSLNPQAYCALVLITRLHCWPSKSYPSKLITSSLFVHYTLSRFYDHRPPHSFTARSGCTQAHRHQNKKFNWSATFQKPLLQFLILRGKRDFVSHGMTSRKIFCNAHFWFS